MFLKLAVNLDRDEFENYQIASHRTESEGRVDSEEYLIFQCLFRKYSPHYSYEMFMNICQNFLVADDQLRQEFDHLLDIISHMYPADLVHLADV